MALADYDFWLPPEAIAQEPLAERDASRLLVLDRQTGALSHHRFSELPHLLRPGDLLVLNDTRVVQARLLGHKRLTGGRAELLLVHPAGASPMEQALGQPAAGQGWVCLGQSSKGLKPGNWLDFEGGLSARVEAALGEGQWRVVFLGEGSLGERLASAGQLPLPPYISRPPTAEDEERYQTIYAQAPGSVAAPTAGLHFTPELFAELLRRGVERATVTLDVGPGTFPPIRADDGRGPTGCTPALRRPARPPRRGEPGQGARAGAWWPWARRWCARWRPRSRRSGCAPGRSRGRPAVHPPVPASRHVDALLTNFHLPRSTLLVLVSAFAGREAVLAAYRAAVAPGVSLLQVRRRDAHRGGAVTSLRFERAPPRRRHRRARGRLHTPHGTVETPVFMPVGTPGHGEGRRAGRPRRRSARRSSSATPTT